MNSQEDIYKLALEQLENDISDSCSCAICARSRTFFKRTQNMESEDKVFFEGVYQDLALAERDRDYYKAMVRKGWPSSKEILQSIEQLRKYNERKT